MKKLPLGIQNFNKIVEGDYVYVDKTQYIYNLINGANYYFLSRPRRFGKSLLLDTISEVFNGDRELFKGLWIYGSDYDFAKHPVIRLDMSNISNDTPEVLKKSIITALIRRSKEENINITDETPSDMFKILIEELHIKYGQRVVVLIDEYDKPILDHLTDIEKAGANRQVMRGFYGILKSMDPCLRFVFITGVSKFTKTSIFSGLNNILDITMFEEYANICGVPIDEFNNYFGEHIKDLSEMERFKKYENIHDTILSWYDGYSWDGKTKLLNPYSLLCFFAAKKFMNYWYVSGSPMFLINMIKEKPETVTNLNNYEINEWMMDAFDIHQILIESLLFQTGYLTVKEIIETTGEPGYALEIPNFEVKDAFDIHILSGLTENSIAEAGRAQREIAKALAKGDLPRMLEMLRSLFASIPYSLHVNREAYYHSIFYAVMSVLGFDMDVEAATSKGRIDAALELGDKVYVMEFKYCKCPSDASEEEKRALFDKTLSEAMEQINSREYAKKYIGSGKAVYQAAFAFLGRDDIEMRFIALN